MCGNSASQRSHSASVRAGWVCSCGAAAQCMGQQCCSCPGGPACKEVVAVRPQPLVLWGRHQPHAARHNHNHSCQTGQMLGALTGPDNGRIPAGHPTTGMPCMHIMPGPRPEVPPPDVPDKKVPVRPPHLDGAAQYTNFKVHSIDRSAEWGFPTMVRNTWQRACREAGAHISWRQQAQPHEDYQGGDGSLGPEHQCGHQEPQEQEGPRHHKPAGKQAALLSAGTAARGIVAIVQLVLPLTRTTRGDQPRRMRSLAPCSGEARR